MTNGIIPSKRRTVWERDGGVCHYCKVTPPDDEQTVDHVWPKLLGGTNANTNLVAACWDCNSRFGHQTHKCFCAFCHAARVAHAQATPTARPLTQRIGDLFPDLAPTNAATAHQSTDAPGEGAR
ncbi:HNH endonuclease [Nocardioides aquiterrae]|uniref:HNH nuclease domain-containing protein n=1 Tax=Nocardioides aquiterrae TaxID=203799 RepID=A0ABN1UDI8_9ACTN